jgi:hypothetical protein
LRYEVKDVERGQKGDGEEDRRRRGRREKREKKGGGVGMRMIRELLPFFVLPPKERQKQ